MKIRCVDTLPEDLPIPFKGLRFYVGPYKGEMIAWNADCQPGHEPIIEEGPLDSGIGYGREITAEESRIIRRFLKEHYDLA